MLNRNAEALFWVGRYMERAENHARLIDVHYHLQHENDFAHEEHKWSRLIDAFGAREDYRKQFDQFTERDVLSFMTLDRGYNNSLFSCVSQARNNLRSIREKLPTELWDAVNAFYLWLGDMQVADMLAEGPNPFFRQVKDRIAMFQGLEHSVLPREQEWHFIESGRYLERAENTVRILHSVLAAISADRAAPYAYLNAVLRSVSAAQAFRKAYADGMSAPQIMEFLLTRRSFPRSAYFAFERLEEHLEDIGRFEGPAAGTPLHERALRQAGKIKAELGCVEREDLTPDAAGALLLRLTEGCRGLGRTMADSFFRLEEASA
ncbi:alpha-E domain-containing protein [Gorillibacterium sp. sgz5001074]|uniref:alpha-E domain-containing protein n=1 Tax=Gorillibacterium sp. sgz5001074 TaxID=3446695 RepID=UPI003F6611FF